MTSIGLSGYLAPDGEWYPCGYQEHEDKAIELVEKYKLEEKDSNHIALYAEFIKFGTAPWTDKEGCSECHVFINRELKPTQRQIEWLEQNLYQATDTQKREVLRILSTTHHLTLAIS